MNHVGICKGAKRCMKRVGEINCIITTLTTRRQSESVEVHHKQDVTMHSRTMWKKQMRAEQFQNQINAKQSTRQQQCCGTTNQVGIKPWKSRQESLCQSRGGMQTKSLEKLRFVYTTPLRRGPMESEANSKCIQGVGSRGERIQRHHNAEHYNNSEFKCKF